VYALAALRHDRAMETLLGLLYFGGAALLVSGILVALVGRTGVRLALVAGLGLVLAGAFFLWAFLEAATDTSPEDCSDCSEWLGRWWEPGFVLWIITVNLFAWSIGMMAGALAHPWARRLVGQPSAHR
jgi:uncharacterized membrane protein